jgi:hypothetical protein
MMPDLVADFIEIDKDLKRRFREDSMTDVLLASFLKLPQGQVRVDTPIEWRTGADFDLFIGERDNNDLAHYRIQAKRLCDHKQWREGRYHSLAHRVRSTRQLQCDTLCSTVPADCIPLYAFYNHRNVVTQAGGRVEGISLADAHAVRRYVHLVVAGNAAYKRIGQLEPLFFPFRTILCPNAGDRTVASPAASKKAAREIIASKRPYWPPTLDPNQQKLFDEAMEERRQPTRARTAISDVDTDADDVILPMVVDKELYEPNPEQVRAEVLAAVQGETRTVRDRHIPRPRVILIGAPATERFRPPKKGPVRAG